MHHEFAPRRSRHQTLSDTCRAIKILGKGRDLRARMGEPGARRRQTRLAPLPRLRRQGARLRATQEQQRPKRQAEPPRRRGPQAPQGRPERRAATARSATGGSRPNLPRPPRQVDALWSLTGGPYLRLLQRAGLPEKTRFPRSPVHMRHAALEERRPSQARTWAPRTHNHLHKPRHLLPRAARHGRHGRRSDGRGSRLKASDQVDADRPDASAGAFCFAVSPVHWQQG